MVWPVIERASPCRTPWASSSFMTWGTPPARWRSVVTKRPDGFRSHSTGTRARIASKSSRASGTCVAWAMADRKSTRLNSSHGSNLVCRLLLEKKNRQQGLHHPQAEGHLRRFRHLEPPLPRVHGEDQDRLRVRDRGGAARPLSAQVRQGYELR